MLLFISILSIADLYPSQQDITRYRSFVIDNREVVWIQVYHHADSAGDLSRKVFAHFDRKAWIGNLRYEGDELVADLADYRPDYRRYGGKYMNTSSVVRNGEWEGKVRISFKDGKYRVILEELLYEVWQPRTGSGRATIEQHQVSGTLDEWALDDYRNTFKTRRMVNLDILHLSFKDSFTLTRDQVIDSDW